MKKLFLNKTRILILFILIVTILSGLLSIYFSYFHHYKGKNVFEEWNITDVFNEEDVVTLYKDPNKDFKIVNFTDTQIRDFNKPKVKKAIHKEMDYLVETYKPDMITFTGDLVMCNYNHVCLKKLIKWLDSYEIPWAPVFGNHDSGDDYDSATCDTLKMCEMFEKSKNCVFSRGPSNLETYGNYVVNLKENGKIIRSMYFLDSGVSRDMSENKINWVKWNADGMKNTLGEYPESFVYTHLPFPEHRLAYLNWAKNPDSSPVYIYHSLSGSNQVGFFNMAKERNFTDFICGHQHGNNFTLPYEGSRFTFAVKTGETSSYYNGEDVYLNGCTIVTVGEVTSISHHYVPRGMFTTGDGENIANY